MIRTSVTAVAADTVAPASSSDSEIPVTARYDIPHPELPTHDTEISATPATPISGFALPVMGSTIVMMVLPGSGLCDEPSTLCHYNPTDGCDRGDEIGDC